jgi:hypothetical protein
MAVVLKILISEMGTVFPRLIDHGARQLYAVIGATGVE